jgi:MOSC domain-containing protein YiiM/GNAT superfamily N-acetyltransferase
MRADGARRRSPHIGLARCLTAHLSPDAEDARTATRDADRHRSARTGARGPYHPLVPDARVVQVNVSAGGVPKMPVEAARVRELGLEGDGHEDRTVHGGPFRAVSLYSMEAIRRVQADGHPIAPGSVGENLTLEGLELSALDAGDRLAIGADVVLEISQPANPCETIRRSFVDGRIGRISILTHPLDSRLYARVLAEGIVRAGDPVQVLPPLPQSDAKLHVLLDRIDASEREASVSEWRAAADGGVDVRFIDDGELAMAATPGVPDENFNRALGLRQLPHLLPDALAFFEEHGVSGWVDTADPPWPGARPDRVGAILAAPTSDLTAGGAGALPSRPPSDETAIGAPALSGHPPSDRIRVRDVRPGGALDWERVVVRGFEFTGALAAAWVAAAPGVARDPRMHLLLAEIDGQPAGAAGVFVHGRVAGLGPGSVLPECRRQGVHAALISARIRLAAELGCDVVAAWAALDGPSERNMLRSGLRRIWTRGSYRWQRRAAIT